MPQADKINDKKSTAPMLTGTGTVECFMHATLPEIGIRYRAKPSTVRPRAVADHLLFKGRLMRIRNKLYRQAQDEKILASKVMP